MKKCERRSALQACVFLAFSRELWYILSTKIRKDTGAMRSRKNYTLEIVKVIAAYMVVFIHVPFPGKVGIALNALARFAVPLFFMVSGFFSYGISTDRIKKRARKLLVLFLVAAAAYILKDLALMVMRNDVTGVKQYFSVYLDVERLLKLVVFNWPIVSGHLWYLLALVYVYGILYLITKYRIRKTWLYGASIVLLTVHLALGEIGLLFGFAVPSLYVRNFLLFGVPFFGLGIWMKKHLDRIQPLAKKCSNWVIFLVLLLGIGATLVSRQFLGVSEFGIGSLLMLLAVLTISFKYSKKRYPKQVNLVAACSAYIYIFHPLVAGVLKVAYGILGVSYASSETMQYLHPVAVCVGSTLLALVINWLFPEDGKRTKKRK